MTSKAKRGRGRPKGTGVLSGIRQHEEWNEIRNRIIYGTSEWRIVRLRRLIGDGSRLPDNTLAAIEAQSATRPKVTLRQLDRVWNKLRAQGKAGKDQEWFAARDELYKAKTGKPYNKAEQPNVIASLWRELRAQFQRAVLVGDADWFTRQASAIDKGGLPQRAQFNAKVVHLFEHAMWRTHAKEGDNRQDLTLTPTGTFTDAMASDIYEALDKHELPLSRFSEGYKQAKEKKPSLVVEGWQQNKHRVMEAIHELARQLQFELRKLHNRKRTKP
ncbi:MAG: hypothetical protein QOH39_2775 [Verrucomicrobiota bacterium]|jgi:hypothetical protein